MAVPMDVRANAMVSERKRMVITVMAAMDIMAPRLVACCVLFSCNFFVVICCVMCFSSKRDDDTKEASKVVWSI